MASHYTKIIRGTDGPVPRNKNDGLSQTRWKHSPLGASRNDTSFDFGFDWLENTTEPKRDYKWDESRNDDYSQSRVVEWNTVGDTMRDGIGDSRRDPNGRTMRENLGINTKKVDLGVTGQTRREEYQLAQSQRSPEEHPYIFNHLDRPGATRRVPLTGDSLGSRATPYRPVNDRGDTHSIERSLPDDDYVYNRQHGERPTRDAQHSKEHYMGRSWTSVAADQNLMSQWHDMFSKIRTKWNGKSGFDSPTRESNSTISYNKTRDSHLSGKCKVLILAISVFILLAMVAVITTLILLGPKTEPDVVGAYELSATIGNMNYTDDMNDPDSEAFHTISKEFCAEVTNNVANNSSGSGYEGCVVNELRNGSVLVLWTIFQRLKPDQEAPNISNILQTIGLNPTPEGPTQFGNFEISVVVVIQPFKPLEEDIEVPSTTLVAFNGTCGSTKRKRQICETKRSKCKNKICSCPTNRIYVENEDSCNKIKCNKIAEIHKGTITATGSKYGSVLKVQCDEGFEWPLDTDIVCETPTSWIDIPDCVPVVCEDFAVPENAAVLGGNISGFVFQDIINVNCDPGYVAEGAQTVTCQANMTWSTPPVCVLIECDKISDMPHGTITHVRGTTIDNGSQLTTFPFNSTVEIVCDDGYELNGDTPTLRCTDTGTWSPNVICIPIMCSEFIPSEDTVRVASTTEPNYPFGSMLTLNCKDGLSFADGSVSTELTCNASKMWSGEHTCEISPTFENDSYLLYVGNTEVIVCDVNAKDVSHIAVYDSNRTSFLNKSADGTAEVNGAFSVNDTETFFQDTRTRLAVNVDLQNWCTNGGVIGNDTYTCEINYKNGHTRSTKTFITVRKSAEDPEFVRSIEIVEDKGTTAEKIFICKGELGSPKGSMEIEVDRTGEFETFLALAGGLNDTGEGWIVDFDDTESECGIFQNIWFALKTVNMSMHLTSMRCVIKPPDNISKTRVSQPAVLKVVEALYCSGSTSYEYTPHPYYCNSAVACLADGTIDGVPQNCLDDQCFDTASITCTDSCEEVGCVYQPIVCDQTETWSSEGSDEDFTCNILDIKEDVTTVSTYNEEFAVNELPFNQQLTAQNVNVTVTESRAILSVVNVSCDNDQEYALTFNNKWTKQLTLRVETEPDIPTITLPEVLNANEEMIIVCRGSVGRGKDNSSKASVHLAVADTNVISKDDVYVTEDVSRETVMEACSFIETATYTITPGLDWNVTYVTCLTMDESTVFAKSAIEPIVLTLQDVFCNPISATALLDGVVSYKCDLYDVANITSIVITKQANEDANTVTVVSESVDSLPWTHSVNFEVDIPNEEGFTLNFANISCEEEGEYTVMINADETPAVMSLAIVSSSSEPSLYVRGGSRVNQLLEINCTSELGRDSKGNQRSDLYLEVKFKNEDEFAVFSDDVDYTINSDNCKHTGVAAVTLYPDRSWNNSAIQCVTRRGNNTYNVSVEETLTLEPSAIYFEKDYGIGIVGVNYTMTCIVEGMVGLTDILITHGDDPADIKGTEGVYIVEDDINENLANMTIQKTIKCGDNGIYYCKTSGTSVDAQAETSLDVHWTSEKPTIDLSADMVADSFAWSGYGTLCSAELGSNNASMFIQTNKNGHFETLTHTEKYMEYNSTMCTNVKTIAFDNDYTADWNDTTFRCVVQDDDVTKMDAEIIYIVSESICDDETTGTVLPHPFDCRAVFTCSSTSKKLQPNKYCAGTEECYDYDKLTCVDCKDVGKCREDPLDIEPYIECAAEVGTIGGSASIVCNSYHITVDDSSTNVTLRLNGETIIDTQSPSGTGPINEDTNTPTLVLQPTTISVDFNPVDCVDEGEYVIRVHNGSTEIEAAAQLDVESTAFTPTITTSLPECVRGAEMTITCTGPVGKPQGSLDLTVRSSSDDNFESVLESTDISYEAVNCTNIGTLSYTFVVTDTDDGFEYRCKSVGHKHEEFVSSIETVTVVASEIQFTDERVTAQIGEQFEVTCNISSESAVPSVAITLISSDGTTYDLCQATFSNGTVVCQTGYTGVAYEDSLVVTGTAECLHEGTLQCFSPSISQIKVNSQLEITRQHGNVSLSVPVAFDGTVITANKLKCTADVGYPSSDRVLKMERKAVGDQSFSDFTEAVAPGGCEVEETTATKSHTFQFSDDGTEFKCVVYDIVENTVKAESDTKTLSVFANTCPTDRNDEIYLAHPLYCDRFLRCYNSGILIDQPCPSTTCYNTTSTTCDVASCDCLLP